MKSREAVRKSRVKSKIQEEEKHAKIADLRRDNRALEQSIRAHKEKADFLKTIVEKFEVAGQGTVSEVGGGAEESMCGTLGGMDQHQDKDFQ